MIIAISELFPLRLKIYPEQKEQRVEELKEHKAYQTLQRFAEDIA